MDASTRDDGAQPHARGRRGRVAVVATLALGALALAGGIVATLSRAGVHQAGTNNVVVSGVVATLQGGHRICQPGERIPAATAAIELTADHGAAPAPPLAVEVLSASTPDVLARGAVAHWNGESAKARLHPPIARERAVRVCVHLPARAASTATLYGEPSERAQSATDGGQPLGGRLRIDYLRAGGESWWALAPTVVARMGRGHAWTGTSVALVAGLLTLISIGLASWLLIRAS